MLAYRLSAWAALLGSVAYFIHGDEWSGRFWLAYGVAVLLSIEGIEKRNPTEKEERA